MASPTKKRDRSPSSHSVQEDSEESSPKRKRLTTTAASPGPATQRLISTFVNLVSSSNSSSSSSSSSGDADSDDSSDNNVEVPSQIIRVTGKLSRYLLCILDLNSHWLLVAFDADRPQCLPFMHQTLLFPVDVKSTDAAFLVNVWRQHNHRLPVDEPSYDTLAWLFFCGTRSKQEKELNLDDYMERVTAYFASRR